MEDHRDDHVEHVPDGGVAPRRAGEFGHDRGDERVIVEATGSDEAFGDGADHRLVARHHRVPDVRSARPEVLLVDESAAVQHGQRIGVGRREHVRPADTLTIGEGDLEMIEGARFAGQPRAAPGPRQAGLLGTSSCMWLKLHRSWGHA